MGLGDPTGLAEEEHRAFIGRDGVALPTVGLATTKRLAYNRRSKHVWLWLARSDACKVFRLLQRSYRNIE
jgi:hypothetical protein